jgi:mono/diheme cytochrome c family protein
MRATRVAAILFVVVVAAAVAFGWYEVRRGFSARAQPSALEAALAHTMRDLSIPRSAKEAKNPWAEKASPEILEAAKAHWADHCATCHANDGSGKTEIGPNLYPKAPDMRLAATQNLTDGELYYVIRNGVRLTGMPAWGDPDLLQDDESWQLVLFIRHLPQITDEEAEAMKALNPKTDADRAEEQQEQDFLNGGELPAQPSGEGHHHE